MASAFPTFKLFQSDGVTLVYDFENVLNWGDGIFSDPETYVEHTSLRGQGGIISPGSKEPWDLSLEFYLEGADYETLVALLNALPTTIAFNTKYILKVQLTSGGSTKDLKVKRLSPIRFPILKNTNKVIQSQRGFIDFRVDVWV